MGKSNKPFNNKKSTYQHNHTHNPKAHNSDERRLEMVKTLQISRLNKIVERLKASLENYIPEDIKKEQEKPMDPKYQLKGAARVAQQYYLPSSYHPPIEPINVLEQFESRLNEHEEGKKLLKAMLELGINLHNIGNKTKQAIAAFKEILTLDISDPYLARHHLLRCYMDLGDAVQARSLIDQHPTDTYSCMTYTKALIEHISYTLNESGASVSQKDKYLELAYQSNPYALFALYYLNTFDDAIEQIELLDYIPAAGSIEDALLFYHADSVLWKETDGALEWIHSYVDKHQLLPPTRLTDSSSSSSSTADSVQGTCISTTVDNDCIEGKHNSMTKSSEKKRKFQETTTTENNLNHDTKAPISTSSNNNNNNNNSDNDTSSSTSMEEINIKNKSNMYIEMYYTAIDMATNK